MSLLDDVTKEISAHIAWCAASGNTSFGDDFGKMVLDAGLKIDQMLAESKTTDLRAASLALWLCLLSGIQQGGVSNAHIAEQILREFGIVLRQENVN